MNWPKKRLQSTCPNCEGLLLPGEGTGPVYSWARVAKGTPPRWEHHRRPPDGFDASAARRLECATCGRAVLLSDGRPTGS